MSGKLQFTGLTKSSSKVGKLLQKQTVLFMIAEGAALARAVAAVALGAAADDQFGR